MARSGRLSSGDVPHGAPSRWRIGLDLISTVMIISACLALVWYVFHPTTIDPPDGPVPAAEVALTGAVVKGSPTAPAVMMVVSSFRCRYCAEFAEKTLPWVNDRYVKSGQLQLAFRHTGGALDPAIASECADEQGRFWEMHDLLFAAPQLANDEDGLRTLAERMALDVSAFRLCANSTTIRAKLERDSDIARALGAQRTPTVFLGRRGPNGGVLVIRHLTGLRPRASYQEALGALLE